MILHCSHPDETVSLLDNAELLLHNWRAGVGVEIQKTILNSGNKESQGAF